MNTNRTIRWLVFSVLMFSLSAVSFAQIGISVRFGPPAIPIYAQPICPGPGYFWTPGYWAWNDGGGYYWVPGTWGVAPVGMLWTPGYWGWGGGFYRWHGGYWGPHVGFYGGINYGFGYGGVGFWGGEWRGGSFFYNRSVMNVRVTNVTNVYERNVVVNNSSRVSYNGGEGGIGARPTPEEERYEREPHREALAEQAQHERAASENKQSFASENHGRPAVAATGRPGEFRGHDVVHAKEAGEPYRAPKMSPKEARASENEERTRSGQQKAEGRNNENNREARSEKQNKNKNEDRPFARQGSRSADRQQAHSEQRQQQQQVKQDKQRQQQQARQEQKHQQQQQRQKQQEQKAQRKQQQQDQKRQRQEQKRGAHEGHGGGR